MRRSVADVASAVAKVAVPAGGEGEGGGKQRGRGATGGCATTFRCVDECNSRGGQGKGPGRSRCTLCAPHSSLAGVSSPVWRRPPAQGGNGDEAERRARRPVVPPNASSQCNTTSPLAAADLRI